MGRSGLADRINFWAWKIDASPSMLRLIQRNCSQPTYYEPPLFHLSVASAKGDGAPLLTSSSTISTMSHPTRRRRREANKDNTIDNDDDSMGNESDDDEEHEPFQTLLDVSEVHCNCTFDTTKEYRIRLAK